ncbi:unnamed protein product [Pleuronectes platessa]|uniref:Uncharacterized protein n=1 Tax=Pleuronectes platessa TaxID=8262 RepID=A0A9N7V1F9_PLEPL|nr:unnamed protein product [Pleuronectes platessa]
MTYMLQQVQCEQEEGVQSVGSRKMTVIAVSDSSLCLPRFALARNLSCGAVFVIRVALTTTLWRGRCGFQPPDILSGGPVGEAAWVLAEERKSKKKGAGLSPATRGLAVA